MIFSKLFKTLPRQALALLALLAAGTLTATAQNERVTFPGRSVTTGRVLRSIETQTNLKFAYSYNTLDTTSVVSLAAAALTVREALDAVVKDKNLAYMIQGRYVAFMPTNSTYRPQVQSQPRTSDVYSQSGQTGDASPVVRPDKPQQTAPVVQQPVSRIPAAVKTYPASFSDYRPIDGYRNLQTTLPRFAIKTNLLYGGLALAPNLAFELATGPKQTIEISGSYNGWRRDDNDPTDTKQLVHSIFRAEYRWWTCERYNGHFFGAHAFYAPFHVSNKDVLWVLDKDNRYEGAGYGIGATYGYNLPLGKSWGLEFNVGVGAAYLDYDQYTCAACDQKPVKKDKWYFGPTRLGVTLQFLIK